MGDWLRTGGVGDGNRPALRRLAHGVLRRHSARAGGLVDSPQRARVGDVAGTSPPRCGETDRLYNRWAGDWIRRPLQATLFETYPGTAVREFLRDVWLV